MPSLREVEDALGISLPPRLVMVLNDPSDPIRKRTEILSMDGSQSQSIVAVNQVLRTLEYKQWPDHIVAFASGGCGDYFAFDASTIPYRVYYIDPIGTVAESVAGCEEDDFVFESFDDWYAYEISHPS